MALEHSIEEKRPCDHAAIVFGPRERYRAGARRFRAGSVPGEAAVMVFVADERPITRINKLYLHPPFLKELEKRRRETRLIESLESCIDKLLTNPGRGGLNLEPIDRCGGKRILSARIKDDDRLILVDLRPGEVGLLFFGGHDPPYKWVDDHRKTIPGMLQKAEELPRGGSLRTPLPFPRADEQAPIAVPDFGAIKTMLARGMERYLAHLDGDQTYLARAAIDGRKGVTLIKGGAGTGKTALAVARVAHLSQLPEMGYGRVLYLCYNRVLAETVEQILRDQFGGTYPRDAIEVSRIVHWSHEYLQRRGLLPPVKQEDGWLRSRIGRLQIRHPELKEHWIALSARQIEDEIRYVLRPNGLSTLEGYLQLERHGMKGQLKQAQRSAIWTLFSELPSVCEGFVELEELPGLALAALETDSSFVPYRSVVVDEGQDFTPVMIRLAKTLVGGDDRRLFVLADTAQSIYPSGFYWTQRELGARGGQITSLRTTYRTTREVYALARSLYDSVTDAGLQKDLGETYPPARTGPLPELAVHESVAEEVAWLVAAIRRDLAGDAERDGWRPEQIAVLAQTHRVLQRVAGALAAEGLPLPAREGDAYQIDLGAATVKLATIHAAKGLDFPVVYLAGLTTTDLFESGSGPGLRPLLYVGMTRSGFRLALSTVEGAVHPLIEALPAARYTVTGSAGERFALRRSAATPIEPAFAGGDL